MAEWIIEVKDGKFPIGKWTELVRCKDCKHWKKLMPEDPDGDERCMLTELYDGREPNDYCSYGERRKG